MFKLGTKFNSLVLVVLLLVGVVVMLITQNRESVEISDQIETLAAPKIESSRAVSQKNTAAKDLLPILKNLGINIDTWNKQTNLAGDLMFDNGVIYDDGNVAGNKVFLDFGMKDKYRVNDVGAIEYWFYVPIGTKVRSPIDGTVQVVFFEHTKDWGVNMIPKESKWIVSFEHLVNLKVKEGDIVRAGDIVGEAAPRIGNRIAMVELAVWTGGGSIIKYCPFNFLDESLKLVYREKINQLAIDWEVFTGQDVYRQEAWIAPGCLVDRVIER